MKSTETSVQSPGLANKVLRESNPAVFFFLLGRLYSSSHLESSLPWWQQMFKMFWVHI